MKKAILISSALLLSACSGGDEIVFDTVLGPVTKAQIEPLPKNLEGDADNANYMATEMTGAQMQSADGTQE